MFKHLSRYHPAVYAEWIILTALLASMLGLWWFVQLRTPPEPTPLPAHNP